MSAQSVLEKAAAKEATPGFANDPDGTPEQTSGSKPCPWKSVIAGQTVQAVWFSPSDKEMRERQLAAAIAELKGIAPKDELEAMIAAQLIAAHNAVMECYRRAAVEKYGFRENLSVAGKLSRTYAMLLDALNRHRGKGQQKITVEHVHIESGGQAVVGIVAAPGGGVQPKSEDQAHGSKTTAKAPQYALRAVAQPSLRSPNAERDALSVSRDAEQPLPDSRREVSGRSEG